ncbi:MAG TPA: hypothetical protein VE549_01045, partial [Myxococcaceae bacterium]|nr:hypothetical protein [Myxococcaceae bacterium]
MRIRRFSFGVCFTSGASLALSLLFTRIFSVTMYYHFAFLLVSLALLGVAVSGVAIYLLPRIFSEERIPWLAGLFAVSIAPLTWIALDVAVSNPMSIDLRADNVERLLKLYVATALPFLASGFSISLAIAGAREHIGRVYAFDLVGAALGCLLMIPMISQFGGPGAILLAGAIAAAGGVLLARSGPDSRASSAVAWAGVLSAVALVAMAIGPASRGTAFRIAQGSKFLNESAVEFERWNALSRVTVSRGEADHKWIHIDADAATRMYSGEIARHGYEAPRRFSESRVASLVYALRREGPALIIGPGGGPDVVAALRAGVPRIVGVEVNPLIAETVMKEHFASYNGDLYRHPSVRVFVDDGRSFVRRAPEAFSSIQATLVDTWAASAAGAFTLTENNLYTVDAFEDYLAHLQPDGVLSMTRWYGNPPVEFLRLVSLGREVLRRRSIPDPEHRNYFVVASDARMATMLLKKAPFTSSELSTLTAEARGAGLRVLHSPDGSAARGDPLLERFLSQDPAISSATLPYDVSPTTDDRPFFFYTLRPEQFPKLLANIGHLERNNLGLIILQVLVLASVALTVLLVVIPLAVLRRDVLRENRGGKLRTLGYFLC